ncbi:MAG: PASTA domain-containing protein [Fimbriimonadaceae bacterium]|nr:PASTA domain-containing protein [Chthonomonadaceae bacterium]MCO5296479.1 PASTA domain-containing protein [Fimbriimonadaceae bacterium]
MIGARLKGRYEVTKLLSEGPLFTLYGARDQIDSKDVSVGVVAPICATEPSFVEKLKQVVGKTAMLGHPGLHAVRSLEVDQDQVFLVGEPVAGAPLNERLRKLGSFSVPVAASMGMAVSEALGALHRSGVVHGDLGSHTTYLLPDGSVKVHRAGLWEAYSHCAHGGALAFAAMAPYLAPEVAAGGMPTPRSDLYAVGVMLFELVTGRLPYIANSPQEMAEKHAQAPVPSVKLFNPSVPHVLDEIIRKAMSKEPAHRYASASELAEDLRLLQDALRFGRPLTWPLRPGAAQDPAPQPVAPKLSAVKPEPTQVYDYDSGDVPTWIKVSIAFFSALLVFMIGGWIVFNFNKPREIVLPNLVGQSVSEANGMLDKMGLRLRIGSKQASEKVAADRILDMNPSPKERVREGAFVTVVVSLGSKFVEAPDLRGMTVDQAKAMLSTVNLELSDSVQEVPDSSVEPGMIVSQLPGPHSKVERFTSIRVKVSSGKGGESDTGDRERNMYSLRIRMTDVPVPVTVRVDMTDADGTRTVHEDYHEPNDTFLVDAEGVGSEVLFRIFYDGELVKQVKGSPREPAQ